MTETLYYIDRETGERHAECIYGEAELRFLYRSKFGKRVRPLFSTSWFSELNALPKRLWFSRTAVLKFAHSYDVNIEEAEKTIDEYQTLDEFFVRKLKQDARPCCVYEQALLSPADGRAFAYNITADSSFEIKGQSVLLSELLQNESDAEELMGGTAVVIRLAPKDYHRFHFPADGLASKASLIPGALESVHPIALKSGASSFENKRTLMHLDTEQFGRVYMVAVGALTIGTIEHSYQPGRVRRGDEHGCFRFGGSTVVMLWGKSGPVIDDDIWTNTNAGYETLVKCGTRISVTSR